MTGMVTSIMGAKKQDGAIDDARGAQQYATAEGNQALLDSYNTQRSDWAPFRQYGIDALNQMSDPTQNKEWSAQDFNYQKDPGYDFRMQEGQKALERSAAARGGLQSGGTMKALAQYGQNFASNEYGNAYNRAFGAFTSNRDARFGRLSYLAGVGQNANAYMSGAAQHYGDAMNGNYIGRGNAEAAAAMAKGQAQAQMWGGMNQSVKDYKNDMNNAASKMAGAGG